VLNVQAQRLKSRVVTAPFVTGPFAIFITTGPETLNAPTGALVVAKVQNTSNVRSAQDVVCGYIDASGTPHPMPSVSVGPSKTVEVAWTIPGSTTPFSIVPYCQEPIADSVIRVSFTIQTATEVNQHPAGETELTPGFLLNHGGLGFNAMTFSGSCGTGPLFTGGSATVSVWNPFSNTQVFTFSEQNGSGATAPLVTITVPPLSTGSSLVTLDPDASINVTPGTGLFNAQLANGTQVPSKFWSVKVEESDNGVLLADDRCTGLIRLGQ
jgi:hypothetical protein